MSQMKLLNGVKDAKTLNFHELDWLGFDLDHTLVRYNVPELSKFIFESVLAFLVKVKGYAPELLTHAYNGSFFVKGLLFDQDRGNFLRLSARAEIVAATHGTRALSIQQAEEIYPCAMRKALCDQLLMHGKPDARFFSFSTFFDMSGALAAAHLVDLLDGYQDDDGASPRVHVAEDRAYSKVVKDMLAGFDFLFTPAHFASDTGYYFPELKKNIMRYVHRTSERVKAWIRTLRAHGVRVFILTNSHVDYTELLMEFSWGEDWRQDFDLVMYHSQKPAFFAGEAESNPFYAVHDQAKVRRISAVTFGQEYLHGNVQQLQALIELESKSDDLVPRVVYVGDHLTGDVQVTARSASRVLKPVLEAVNAHKTRSELFDIDSKLAQFFKQSHTTWGSFFEEPITQEETRDVSEGRLLFEEILRMHTSIATPHLDALAEASERFGALAIMDPDMAGGGGFIQLHY